MTKSRWDYEVLCSYCGEIMQIKEFIDRIPLLYCPYCIKKQEVKK